MKPRAEYDLRFADGGTLSLGKRTAVMGVINVTPDSFADGGSHDSLPAALERAAQMIGEGVDIIDVGGESTRPGAEPVPSDEEIGRVVPVVREIKRRLDVRVSVDTRKASVARRAIGVGADLINDVTALGDPEMLELLVETGAPVVLMHMRGTPRTMQDDTDYDDLTATVTRYLDDRAKSAVAGGIDSDKIVVDPGIGFGKSAAGSLLILDRLSGLGSLAWPVLVGASRKSFIGAALDLSVEDRLEASLAVAALAAAEGAHVIRAHDVAATVRCVGMIDAIRDVGSRG